MPEQKTVETRSKEQCPESEVVRVWNLINREVLLSEDGEPVRVVYPGRPNDGRGADFQDAVIRTPAGIASGDIEIHTRSSDWWNHGHDKDPQYQNVVLHVVMWNDAKFEAGGRSRIPIIALDSYAGAGEAGRIKVLSQRPAKCAGHLTAEKVSALIDEAGDRRFLDNASIFGGEIADIGAGQCLHRGIMGALGYAKNRVPFAELAERVPLAELEAVSKSTNYEEEALIQMQTILLGTAGLLPSQRTERTCHDCFTRRLESEWRTLAARTTMSYRSWETFKVRPGNFPARRMAAMSYLVWRCRDKGLLETVIGTVKEAPDETCLQKSLEISVDGYWAGHYGLGLSAGKTDRALIGDGRASEITVNIVLPFVFAWGGSNGQDELHDKAFELYKECRPAAGNSIVKHMRNQLGLINNSINSARKQQGLIHIYKTFCTRGSCGECGLNQLQTGNSIQV